MLLIRKGLKGTVFSPFELKVNLVNLGVELFSTNIQNGSEVTWGDYIVSYKALDKAGNAAQCRFLFTIAGR